jgi:hypothetical protein
MRNIDKMMAFRSSKNPVMALWSIGDVSAYGSLIWMDNTPILTLSIEVTEDLSRVFDKDNLPI